MPAAASTGAGGFAARPQRATAGSGGFAKTVLQWAGGHKILTAIIVLNVIALIPPLFDTPLLVFSAIQLPIGLLIGGALFLPRLHIVDHVFKALGAIGGQMAGVGAGGITLLLLAGLAKVGLRVARRSGRNDNLDFSGFDPSSLGALAGSLVIFLCVSALIIFLWKQIGIVRMIAAGYLLEMSVLTFILIIGGALKSKQDADIDRRHDEAIARMQSQDFSPPGIRPPDFRDPRSRTGGYRPPGMNGPNSSEIRVLIMHGPNADVDDVREQLLSRVGDLQCEATPKGSLMTEFTLQDSRDPQEVAELIDFGRVMSVSQMGRSIRVGMPRTGKTNERSVNF